MNTPLFITKDTYEGQHVMTKGAKHRVTVWEARELAKFARDGVVVIFESFGHVGGVEKFTRTRFIADGSGDLHGYDSDGAKKIVHPGDRKLRILTV